MALPDLVVNIVAKFDDFREAMKGVESDLDKAGKSARKTETAFASAAAGIRKIAGPAKIAAAAVAAASAATFGLAASTASAGDEAAKTADKLGIGIEALQELRFAAERSGVAAGTFDTAMQRMTRRIAEAAAGSGAAKGAIEQLGLSAEALAGKTPDQALGDIADAMSKVENQSERLALSFKLFDSEGAGLVNTLAGGSEGLDEMRAIARETGAVLSEDTARASEQFQDKMQDLKASFAGLRNEIGEKLIPIFVDKVIPVMIDHVIPALVKTIEVIAGIGPAIGAMRTHVTETIAAVRQTFTDWVDWFRALPDMFMQFGIDIITGFQQGIANKFDEVRESLQRPFKEFGSNVKDFFGISSPSKMFREFGAWVSEGFAQGVNSGADQIEASAAVFDEFSQKAETALRKNRKIAAAEAFINAGRAASQALADPSLPWFAKIGAAASVFAAGKQFAAAIERGTPSGGGASGAGGAATSAPSQAPLQVQLSGMSADQLFSGGDIGTLLQRLQAEAGDRGLQFV